MMKDPRQPIFSDVKPLVTHYRRKVKTAARHRKESGIKYEFDLPPVKIPVKGKRYTFMTIPAFNYGAISRN